MHYVKEIVKNKTEIIRISIDEYRGERILNIRVYYKDKEGNWMPTKKGIAIRLDIFPELKSALDEVEEIINDYKK